MAADSDDTHATKKPDIRSVAGKVRLMALDDIDQRTLAARNVKATRTEVIADLGGEAGLSTLEKAAVDHVSVLDALIKDAAARWLQGHDIPLSDINTCVNTFNRSASALGWQRRSRDVTPDIYAIAATKGEGK